jgi:hypothetical protein
LQDATIRHLSARGTAALAAVTTAGHGAARAWAAGCSGQVCGNNIQQIAGPDGRYGEVAKARVYFVLNRTSKYAFVAVWCEDRYGTERPCQHIYISADIVVPSLPAFNTSQSAACGHSAPACPSDGLAATSRPLIDCRQLATYGLGQPINVELPHGAADNNNRVGSFTVDTAC